MRLFADHLLRLYPPGWRQRYGDEFLATVGREPLSLQQVIDIVSGAIDAWLSPDVRHATNGFNVVSSGGRFMTLQSLLACESRNSRYTKRDSLVGAAVMIGVTLFFSMAGTAARRAGWPATADALIHLAFPVSLMLSMPFWLLKGQPWKAQLALVGGTLVLLGAAGYLSSM